ncbi:hypothetical protein Tsubulata_002284 [Turnera subulata]|uniref:Uncharacterized protein n=1 Tax=Turnera subulata TaxID=218843 RepID=A0A9Q0FX86_9ROSI|nr:hypothetical protein Tsubulata_002284 [Turnera subulata]
MGCVTWVRVTGIVNFWAWLWWWGSGRVGLIGIGLCRIPTVRKASDRLLGGANSARHDSTGWR